MAINHIAFIPDGNRRWAKKNGKSIAEAYDIGIRKIKDVLEWCKAEDIKEATFWGFSTDNFKRSEEEKRTIWGLFNDVLLKALEEYRKTDNKDKDSVKISFLGRLGRFPEDLRRSMEQTMKETEDNGPYKVNIMLAYGGREEIVDAVNMALDNGKERITEEDISAHAYFQDPVDLIIRTGGELRTSGYLLWHSPYAELFFSQKLWPDFGREDLVQALDDFKSRERRFGR